MALESLFLRLETLPGCLCEAETQTVQMRPSQPKSEEVTNWQIFQKPPWNQEKSQLPGIKCALEPKIWVHMSQETTQMKRLGLPVEMAPWRSKSEMVANWRNFQKLTATPKMAKKISKCKKSNFSRPKILKLRILSPFNLYLNPVSTKVLNYFFGSWVPCLTGVGINKCPI